MPNRVRPGTENVTTRDVIVIEHLALEKDLFKMELVQINHSYTDSESTYISVPSGEVFVLLESDSHLVSVIVGSSGGSLSLGLLGTVIYISANGVSYMTKFQKPTHAAGFFSVGAGAEAFNSAKSTILTPSPSTRLSR